MVNAINPALGFLPTATQAAADLVGSQALYTVIGRYPSGLFIRPEAGSDFVEAARTVAQSGMAFPNRRIVLNAQDRPFIVTSQLRERLQQLAEENALTIGLRIANDPWAFEFEPKERVEAQLRQGPLAAMPVGDQTRRPFRFEPREPRFTNENTNLILKERIAQYGDYLQQLIQDFLGVEEGFFGEEIRYGLCPEGAIGLFEKESTGGGPYWRLRGVYLEEELVDALHSSKQRLFALYPAIVAHEISHAWEYDRTHYEEWYGRLNFDFYTRDTFYEHLDELQVDARGMELLRQLHFEIPLYKGQDAYTDSYMTQSEVELQRLRQFDDVGRLVEIMGKEDLEQKMFLKVARNLGRLLFVVSREGADASHWLPRIKAWRTEAHRFLQRFTDYPKCRLEEVAQLFLEYLAMQKPEFPIDK